MISEIMIGLILLLITYLSSMVAFVQYQGDTSIANFTWGGGVMLVAIYTFFTMSNSLRQQQLITLLIICWASRLIIYVYRRYTGKDPRFISWRWQGMKALGINICWIFGQTILIAIMSYPSILINTNNTPRGLSCFDFLGLAIWLFGYCYESISDYQLSAFIRNPLNKGHVMNSGLWHYCRHPNYFGEIIIWWGIFCIALSLPYGYTAIITPLTITCLLLFVTGIPWLEKSMENNPEYQEYKRKTSMIIPWFVRK